MSDKRLVPIMALNLGRKCVPAGSHHGRRPPGVRDRSEAALVPNAGQETPCGFRVGLPPLPSCQNTQIETYRLLEG